MAVRKPADVKPEDLPDGITASLLLALAENAALSRALCALAVAMPGPPETTERVLTDQMRIARADVALIIAAAKRPG